jgi:hypothetical protein
MWQNTKYRRKWEFLLPYQEGGVGHLVGVWPSVAGPTVTWFTFFFSFPLAHQTYQKPTNPVCSVHGYVHSDCPLPRPSVSTARHINSVNRTLSLSFQTHNPRDNSLLTAPYILLAYSSISQLVACTSPRLLPLITIVLLRGVRAFTLPTFYQSKIRITAQVVESATITRKKKKKKEIKMSANVLANKDVNMKTGAVANQDLLAKPDVKSMEYHRQVLQNKMAQES